MNRFSLRREKMKLRTFYGASMLLVAFLFPLQLVGEKQKTAQTVSAEDFLIISSVDAKKQQLLLKHPTEVTELILVTDKTAYLDEQGRRLHFTDFRAGDTVYISSFKGPTGVHVATRIRKAPMTLEELHRRYLKFR